MSDNNSYKIVPPDDERKAISRYFKKINETSESRLEFLKSAKMLDRNGKIRADLCILQPED